MAERCTYAAFFKHGRRSEDACGLSLFSTGRINAHFRLSAFPSFRHSAINSDMPREGLVSPPGGFVSSLFSLLFMIDLTWFLLLVLSHSGGLVPGFSNILVSIRGTRTLIL